MKVSQWSTVASRWSTALGSRAAMFTSGNLGAETSAAGRPANAEFITARRPHGILRMDMTWVTEQIAVGGGIWTAETMAEVAEAGVTHIIDMQIEFDDTPLAEPHGIEVLWNAIDDDFQPKGAEIFERGVEFARQALETESGKLLIHCAAGVHRAPMMALAVLCASGWDLGEAMELIETRRPVVDFAEVYVESVEKFLRRSPVAGRL
jgi:protein-tyrosine phosphatase